MGSTTCDLPLEYVLRLLAGNEQAAGRSLNLVASENAMSGVAKLPLLLDTYHRYFFNETEHAERWRFRGGELVAELETRFTVPLLTELAQARFANVRPLSGISAMTLVLAALGGPPGSTVATVAPAQGGHYATAGIAGRMGLHVELLGGPDAHTVDYDRVADVVARSRPALVYVDQSNALFPLDVRRLVDAVRAAHPATLVHVDASHWMGLVLGKVFANPLACGADSFGGSTHKTFPGPQKAVFVTDREDLAERVRQTQDFMLSSHHFAATISLGIALLEFRDFGGERYARSVVENTRSFARALDRCGVDVAAADRGYSAGHQLWLDVEAGGVGARVASDRLYEAGLRVNFLDDLPGFSRPALRIGLNEATFRGVGDEDLDVLAEVFAAALHARAPAAQLAASVAEVLSRSHRRYGIPVVPGEPLLDQALALCAQALAGTPVADDVCRRV